jgi:hypothetical protein
VRQDLRPLGNTPIAGREPEVIDLALDEIERDAPGRRALVAELLSCVEGLA